MAGWVAGWLVFFYLLTKNERTSEKLLFESTGIRLVVCGKTASVLWLQ